MPFFWSKMQAAVFKYKLSKCSELTIRLLLKEEVDDTSDERILKRDRKRGNEYGGGGREQEHCNMLLNQQV